MELLGYLKYVSNIILQIRYMGCYKPPFIGCKETVLNVEPVCGSAGVTDTSFISSVDP
jgi:hypothetical protein